MPRSGGLLSQCEGCGAEVHAREGGAPPEKMVHRAQHGEGVACPLRDRRKCEWCGGPMKEDARANAVTCGDKCRAARWKHERNYGRTEPGPRSGAQARSGRQISYAKALRAVATYLGDYYEEGRPAGLGEAEKILKPALPVRQRTRSGREARKGTSTSG